MVSILSIILAFASERTLRATVSIVVTIVAAISALTVSSVEYLHAFLTARS
jgi:hypothetical protein